MSKRLSKFGLLLVFLYGLFFVYAVVEFVSTPAASMKEFAVMILTMPGSFALALFFDYVGFETSQNLRWFWVFAVFGWLINSVLLLLIGTLTERAIGYLLPKSE